ncbi:hypothetical protein [Marinifilum sp.]|uniref:hypothetical protein n=1 Tax=Marinifilum sp. TaxID=2033137 RepID=UPI003BA94037
MSRNIIYILITSAVFVFILSTTYSSDAQSTKAKLIKEYHVKKARQAVATDVDNFYVINNSNIAKYRKVDGKLATEWEDNDSIIHHLNSGIIIEGKLYCCNSNYPKSPMASSIEIFDPQTLKHIGNHSFGIFNGSATWLDFYNGYWYVVFAHYTGRGNEAGKDNSWTRMVKFDKEWRQLESWIFPEKLVSRFGTKSSSGGKILEDGRILCTGHDNYEIYELCFPKKGYALEWIKTIPVASFGQGIAYEKKNDQELIYGIVKKENKVVVSIISETFH